MPLEHEINDYSEVYTLETKNPKPLFCHLNWQTPHVGGFVFTCHSLLEIS